MATSWDNLTPNQSAIRAAHIEKLRAALHDEMARRKMADGGFSAGLSVGAAIRAVHVQELRDKINGIKKVTFGDNPIVPNGTIVRAEHLTQLENAINYLEAGTSEGGVTTCDSSCMGLCVGCTASCLGACTSCSGCTGCAGTCSGSCLDQCGGDCRGRCSGDCSGCGQK